MVSLLHVTTEATNKTHEHHLRASVVCFMPIHECGHAMNISPRSSFFELQPLLKHPPSIQDHDISTIELGPRLSTCFRFLQWLAGA